MLSNDELKNACALASARTEQWMLNHLENLYENDVPYDPMTYYKWPLALQERGRRQEARKLLAWIKGHCLTEQGDFSSARSGFHMEFYSYANLWLILAAIELGEKPLYELLLGFLYSRYNRKTGGLTTNPTLSGDLTEDPLSTSFLGMAACSLKYEELANSALDYLQVWINQPIEQDRLWLRTSQDGSLIRQIPTGADPSTYVIELGKTDESYYFLGSICFFLARYMEIFYKRKALGLANQVAEMLEHIGPKALNTIWAAKVAPGCTALYGVTSEQRFLDIAQPVIQAVLAGQNPDGYWLKNNKPWVTVSAEQCYWLSGISKRL
ncbi:MAG: hypothetical protein KAQ62_01880 [Cyclobacteriaceae bacterium]|nr:hypothetical protein [Cyclobacteriaceae bacterium]